MGVNMSLTDDCLSSDRLAVNDVVFKLASFASRAVLYEVSAFPKPGLVSPISTGAHFDMDYFTFLDSTTALMKYFVKFSEAGYSSRDVKEIFGDIREVGVEAERAMFDTTDEVNTHKGMIFLMGVSLAATAKVLYEGLCFECLSDVVREMTRGIVLGDLQHLTVATAVTHGERLYVEHGITGVRGEVEAGMPTVFLHALPFFQDSKELSLNERLVQTLFKIVSVCDDTTIVHRHDVGKLFEVKEQAKYFLDLGGVCSKEGRVLLEELCQSFVRDRVSPGGCADLLAVTVFFDFVNDGLFSKVE